MLYSLKASHICHVTSEPTAECHFVALYTKQLCWSLIILSLMFTRCLGNAGVFFMSNWEVKDAEVIVCVMLLKVKPVSDMQLNIMEIESQN